jgi:hypothetical protein
MKQERRGSEKLLANCRDLQTLSQAELEKVAGAGLLSSPMGVWKAFPRGIPWPEVFAANELAAIKQLDAAVK